MANEISVSATLQFAKGQVATKNLTASFKPTLTGTNYTERSMSIPTTAGGTAIDVAGLANVGWFIIKNNDLVNYVQLMSAVSGTVLLQLLPGEIAMGRFDPTITAPAAIAHTSACQIEYLILEI